MPNRIKELRKNFNMTQADLGKIVGVSTSAIGMYEQGRRDPDTHTLLNIAKALDVSIDYLIGESESKDRFDIDTIAKNITDNLMEQPALMFSADCYNDNEILEISKLIENSVRNTLIEKLDENN